MFAFLDLRDLSQLHLGTTFVHPAHPSQARPKMNIFSFSFIFRHSKSLNMVSLDGSEQ